MRIFGSGGLFFAAALVGLSGCGGGTNATVGTATTAAGGGTTTGGASGTTSGGTTGTACARQYYHCFNPGLQSNCCAGLICNSSNLCGLPPSTTTGGTTSGTTSGTSTSGSTSGGSTTGGSTGACPGPSGDGGPCVTSVDCNAGFVCTSDQGNGYCTPPVVPTISACSASGASCGGPTDGICCGVCVNSSCRDLSAAPCGYYPGALCAADSDCCRDWKCVTGGCQPRCGLENALCNPANGNADCCVGEGLTCQGYGGDGGVPYECNNLYVEPAGQGCATFCAMGGPPECELGSPCNPTSASLDNCVAAGLFCDPSIDVCVQPKYGDLCIPGGPPCGAGSDYEDSNVTLVCTIPSMFTSSPVCLQLCGSTKDCLFGPDSCCTTCSPPVCVPTDLLSTCSPYFTTCNLEGTGDGICAPTNVGGTLVGVCNQATTVGGKTGSACNTFANRQNPAFCDTSDWCSGSICVPVCNAGTAGNPPSCPDSKMVCASAFGQTADTDDMGYCITPCDFLDGGGCKAPDGGLPQVCFPNLFLVGPPDNGSGACAGQVRSPLPVGSPCNPIDGAYNVPSPCVAGAICWNNPVAGGGYFCDQLCLLSTSNCSAGTTCHNMNLAAGVYSSVTGICY